ncbi:MAG: dipeptidase [Planctomycetaceae bacterium]|nr:dipeptidase [Planctomycetaceae bacterium]MBQ2821433.1 dipeptidase [Thermoguttaceae bacterium]
MLSITDYLSENSEILKKELFELLRIPSISAQTEHEEDCRKTAEWLRDYFLKIGFSSQLFPVSTNHPMVYAESPFIPGAKTLLIYGHYDVQPVDPLELWETAPFEPVEKDGYLYGRGTSDDKGPLFTHIAAAKFWMSQENRPHLNVKFILEGDEESSGSATEIFVREHTDLLSCDYLALSDSTQFAPGCPSITCGLRGVAAYELTLFGPRQDLHSGMFGGAVTNPCTILMEILGEMHDSDRRITIPGFYDAVKRLSPEDEEQLRFLPFDDAAFFESAGVSGGIGEADMSVLERITTRPTFDINGITGGYQGEGGKTIIPAKASAKFTFRLVPNQDPEWLTAALSHWLEERIPEGIEMKLDVEGTSGGYLLDLDRPCMKAAAHAMEFGFGRSPFFVREGGSIPIVAAFSKLLTPNVMLLAYSQKTDNAHGPNEHFCLTDFWRGIKTNVKLWQELTALD